MDDALQGIATVLVWTVLRFGLPVGLTLLVCWLFKWLDARWQAEAEEYQKRAGVKGWVPIVRCWLLNDCPPEQREHCHAYQNQEVPCWQHFRAPEGELKEKCMDCGVFQGVPLPSIGD
jgi:hypothetical protein